MTVYDFSAKVLLIPPSPCPTESGESQAENRQRCGFGNGGICHAISTERYEVTRTGIPRLTVFKPIGIDAVFPTDIEECGFPTSYRCPAEDVVPE